MRREPASGEERSSWIVPTLLWLCLFAAGGVYALVALAPKLLVTVKLRAQYHANQVELVRLERQIVHLESVAAALEKDPGFAAEMARLHFGGGLLDEQRIRVEGPLALDVTQAADAGQSQPAVAPWYLPWLSSTSVAGTRRGLALVALALTALAIAVPAGGPASGEAAHCASF